ncbi:MAG: DUF362 domain-containing protein [Synergistaceae bacterium]|nr:DUF362 domain-containing protein [Synergistaceae bacterium]
MSASRKLILQRQGDYDREGIEATVNTIFRHFGGLGNFIKQGDQVLLKVNLVAGCEPERRVTTDPSVVRAVAKAVLEVGGHPVIADSPGLDNFLKAAEKAGLLDVARDLDVPCVELTDSIPLSVTPDATFRKIEVARRVLESDAIINLPKMKTHAQMLLTLGVKNLFGCVVAQRKAEWHYSVGLRRERFASLLLDIWNGIRPTLTILDGVVGMDGRGPTNGKPFPYGIMAGAQDALTMDFWLCRMMGVRLEDYPLWQAANLRGMSQCKLDDNDLAGDFPAYHIWESLEIPKLDSLNLVPILSKLPFAKFLEQALMSRPYHRSDRCIVCGKCAAICKAQAISMNGKKLIFDYRKCIRCYCCHEMCPVDAIGFQDGLLMKLMKAVR